jgi:hypothetical protein
MKSTLRVLALVALMIGSAACAKYPMVVSGASPAPTASAPAPIR